jgi:MFS family permease
VEAQRRFGTTAAVLGLFAGLQLAVYASLQIPVGMLLDRIGSKRLIVTGATTMGIGQLALATAHTVTTAALGRVLVGTGDAMTFISVLRLIPAWFPARQVPVLSQLTAILGQIGQIAAAYPLVALLGTVGWATSFTAAGCGALILAGTIAVWLRSAPAGASAPVPPTSGREVRARLAQAWREPRTRLGLWTHFVTQFSAVVFGLLWGYPFLVVGEHRTPAEAGFLLALLVACSMLVAPALGQFAIRWPSRRSVPTLSITCITVTAWAIVLLWPGRAPMAILVLLMVALSTNGPRLDDGLRLRPHREPPRPDRIGQRHRERRRVRRFPHDNRADRDRAQRDRQRRSRHVQSQ